MNKAKLIKVIVFISFFLGLIIYIVNNEIDVNKINSQFNDEFPSLRINESVSGYVTNIIIPKEFRNYPYSASIVLNDTLKRSFLSYSKPKGLVVDETLNIGSYIRKAKGSDMLIIYNIQKGDTLEYKFRLEEPSN